MKRWILFLGVFFVAPCLCASDLIVFCGAGLMKPMNDLAAGFEEKNNIDIQLHYGGSGEIFASLAGSMPCDVFIPGAEKYTLDAVKNGWVKKESIIDLVLHEPVIIVPADNTAHIGGIDDLKAKGVSLAMGDPKATAIGRIAKKILVKNTMYKAVEPNIKVMTPTVNQLLVYVTMSQVDAAIVWRDMTSWVQGKAKVKVIDISGDRNMIKTVPAALCVKAEHKAMGLRFIEYISSPMGREIWHKWGFEPVGD